MKRIIVDIDNTLWDFAAILYQKVSKLGVPEPSNWHWDFWEAYMSFEQFMKYIDEVHKEQDESKPPFPESRGFLNALKETGYHITMASHRNPENYSYTKKWLVYHELAFDDLYVGHDKTKLFDANDAVVDDDVETLNKAADKKLVRAGLRYSWNKDSGHPLFENLNEVLGYLEKSRLD